MYEAPDYDRESLALYTVVTEQAVVLLQCTQLSFDDLAVQILMCSAYVGVLDTSLPACQHKTVL